MKYLIDTCIISELIKNKPNESVVNWITGQDEQDLFLSILTFGEIYKGIKKISTKSKKARLSQWIEHDLKERFKNRILPIDINVALMWGKIQGGAELEGKPMPAIDSLIAATGLAYNLTVVTRNISDMEQSKVALLNPWKLQKSENPDTIV
jgi:toxin FitB